jgi:pimeloyl-ACP methyl ester carboxylesterase
MRVLAIFAAVALLAGGRPVAAATAQIPAIQMAEFMVPTGDPGISVYLRNKHPRGMTSFRPEKVVLFVHGSTYPAETAFDLPLGGMSWMDYIARHGYDVWLVDVRGYGRSSRPPEMDQPASANPPIVHTTTAVKDVGTAVDFIKTKRHVSKIDLIGWSWGTSMMGMYTADHNANVNKLVLYAPQWLRAAGSVSLTTPTGPLGAYRTVSMASAKTRWLTGVAPDKAEALIPAGWFEQWAAATLASDPVGSKMDPPVLRAPNGTVADTADYWAAGKPLYDPSRITVPTLLIHAEWDQDLPTYMDEAYYKLLTNVPYKRYVQIGEGTHTIIMEKNRLQLFSEVQLFLDEHRVTQ